MHLSSRCYGLFTVKYLRNVTGFISVLLLFAFMVQPCFPRVFYVFSVLHAVISFAFKVSATLQDCPRADRSLSAFICLVNPKKPYIFGKIVTDYGSSF